jgi:hypothetical protein
MEPRGVNYGPHSADRKQPSPATRAKQANLTRFSAAHKRTSSLPVNKTKVRTEKPAWDAKARALLTNFLGLLTDAKTTVQETLRAAKEFLRGTKGMNPPAKQVAAEEVKKSPPETKAVIVERVIVILQDEFGEGGSSQRSVRHLAGCSARAGTAAR